jgi:hypothetical protein
MKRIFSLLIMIFLATPALAISAPVLASGMNQPTQVVIRPHFFLAAACGKVKTSIDYGCSNNNGGEIYGFLRGIIKFASGLVGLVVIMMMIIGGIRYITSAGDPKMVASAKNQIVNAVTGLVLFGLMLAILNFLLPGGIIG